MEVHKKLPSLLIKEMATSLSSIWNLFPTVYTKI